VNLVTGRIVEIYVEDGVTKAKASVSGAFIRVALTLLMNARVGDEILIESGVAISSVNNEEKENEYVLGDSRESARN
jgi:hydrogenase maturation factor